MSSPFNPNEWPEGYGPGSGFAGGGAGGGDVPPPYDDEDAPPEDDAGQPPADPTTGASKQKRKSPPTAAEQRAAFIKWVQLQLSRVEAYGQPVRKQAQWCPEWWKHPEVVQRLYVSWRGYLKAAKLQAEGDGLAKSAWWVQHWDHHARIIFDEQYGPFRACNSAGHLADNKGERLTIRSQEPPEDVELI
ncbi:DUF4913 domain-containing protein [Curtobacterium flaccumfaciens]|uniref:DUF4913 domain-containing protein n=1 Tax=Curtobacterium flaccumfaciens TaxID=2035 RepID=UPI001E286C86|nr:DUF4913 domain-containing protein [Curtobacterium allii]MCE0459609.1 DUF4913 domain-containing protein [Curtobacterium allii]